MGIRSVGDRITLLRKINGFRKALRVQARNRVQKEFMVSRLEMQETWSQLYALVFWFMFLADTLTLNKLLQDWKCINCCRCFDHKYRITEAAIIIVTPSCFEEDQEYVDFSQIEDINMRVGCVSWVFFLCTPLRRSQGTIVNRLIHHTTGVSRCFHVGVASWPPLLTFRGEIEIISSDTTISLGNSGTFLIRLFKKEVREVFKLLKNMCVLLFLAVIFSPQNVHMRGPSSNIPLVNWRHS